MMARSRGREVQIIVADRRSQTNLKQDERLSGELDNRASSVVGGYVIFPRAVPRYCRPRGKAVPEGRTLLDGAAARHNVQC